MNHARLTALFALVALAHATPLAAQAGEQVISLHPGRSKLLELTSEVETVAVADPSVIDVKPLSPTQVLVLAKSFGATDLLLTLKGAGTVVYAAHVRPNVEELQDTLQRLFSPNVTVEDLQGTVAVRGTIASVEVGAAMSKFMADSGVKWADLTRLAGVQQVQLRVRIAEASRTALRSLGLSVEFTIFKHCPAVILG